MVSIGQFAQFKSEGRIVHKIEVLNRWRRLDLPIMPPGPVSFHAFSHKLAGLNIFEYCIDGSGFSGTEILIAISATTAVKVNTSKITTHLAFFSFKVLHLLCQIC